MLLSVSVTPEMSHIIAYTLILPAADAADSISKSKVSADAATCLAVAVAAEYPISFASPST